MKNKQLYALCLFISLIILAGCQTAQAPKQAVSAEQATPAATSTIIITKEIPVAPTRTPAPAYTATPLPTATIKPTATLNPTAVSLLAEGKMFYFKKDYTKAVDKLSEAIQIDPKNPDAYVYRGLSYQMLLKYDRALDEFRIVIQLDPNNAKGYEGLASMYLWQGDFKAVMEVANKAIQLAPDQGNNYATRAATYIMLNQFELAKADYLKSVELNASLPHAYNQFCYQGGLDGYFTDKTVQDACDRAVRFSGGSMGFILDSRALVRALNGDLKGAADDLRQAIPLLKNEGFPKDSITLREGFLKALEAGQNPYDAATLEKLRKGA